MSFSFPKIFRDPEPVITRSRKHRQHINERYADNVVGWEVPDDIEQRLGWLKKRQLQVLRMMVSGLNLQMIASELELCASTTNNHRLAAYKTLGINNVMQLMLIAIEVGWVETKSVRLAREAEEQRQEMEEQLRTLRH